MKLLKLLLVLMFGLTGCASIQPLKPDEIVQLKSGKTAISVHDHKQTITYENLTYYGLGVAQSKTTATYSGFLDTEKIVGVQLSQRFNERGLKTSVHQLPASLWSPELIERFSDGRGALGSDLGGIENRHALPTPWKDYLVKSGYDYLFLGVIPGMTILASNFDTKEVTALFGVAEYLYDVKKGTLIWSAGLNGFLRAPIKDSPKEVENNDFALIKEMLAKGVDTYFTADRGGYKGIDTGMGLRPKLE